MTLPFRSRAITPGAAAGRAPRAAFSLIELIGVLAIMAILASVVVPNVLKSIDRAAVKAEASNLDALGDQVKQYLRSYGVLPSVAVPPTVPNWTTELATLADLSPTDILTNRRGVTRVYVTQPATQRAMILSSMRSGLNLPTYAQINGNFSAIWDTGAGNVPTTAGWTGAWTTTPGVGDYLLIELVNLAPIYATDLISLTVTLNNYSALTVSYRITTAAGVVGPPVPIDPSNIEILPGLRPRDRVDLYNSLGALNYSYVLNKYSSSFDFGGTQWLPTP